MKHTDLVQIVASKTHIPAPLVRQVLAAYRDTIREALVSRQEIYMPELLRLVPEDRKFTVRNPRDGSRNTVRRLVIRVLPVKQFRKLLTKWSKPEDSP